MSSIESHTPEYPLPTDVLRILIKKTQDCGEDSWCHFDDASSAYWAEVAPDKEGLLVNLPYPYKEKPEFVFPEKGIRVPPSWEVVAFRKKGLLSSGYITYRTSKEDTESIISFVDGLFKSMSDMGSDYRLYGSLQS